MSSRPTKYIKLRHKSNTHGKSKNINLNFKSGKSKKWTEQAIQYGIKSNVKETGKRKIKRHSVLKQKHSTMPSLSAKRGSINGRSIPTLGFSSKRDRQMEELFARNLDKWHVAKDKRRKSR